MQTQSSPQNSARVVVLYVEDDESTANLFRIVTADLQPNSQVFLFDDGKLALKFLNKQAPYTDAPLPDLIVLDVNLPRDNGFDLLRRIRREPHLADVPAIFFSTSDSNKDHQMSLDLGALALVHKPLQLDQFEKAVEFMLDQVEK